MIIFSVLVFILVFIAVLILSAVGGIGLLFSDAIMFILIVWMLIKLVQWVNSRR